MRQVLFVLVTVTPESDFHTTRPVDLESVNADVSLSVRIQGKVHPQYVRGDDKITSVEPESLSGKGS